jgi:hypothetical protein
MLSERVFTEYKGCLLACGIPVSCSSWVEDDRSSGVLFPDKDPPGTWQAPLPHTEGTPDLSQGIAEGAEKGSEVGHQNAPFSSHGNVIVIPDIERKFDNSGRADI